MKYTPEICAKLVDDYTAGVALDVLAHELGVPERSIIAKLSTLGVYKKKPYLTKRGELPVKKEVYIERIAHLLDANLELLESLGKVNKQVLVMLEHALQR